MSMDLEIMIFLYFKNSDVKNQLKTVMLFGLSVSVSFLLLPEMLISIFAVAHTYLFPFSFSVSVKPLSQHSHFHIKQIEILPALETIINRKG